MPPSQSGKDILHAIELDSESDHISSSPNIPIRPSPLPNRGYQPLRTKKPQYTTETEREEVNKRIREKGLRPNAGASSMSTRDLTTEARTIPYPPWSIELVLITERFYFDTEMDRTDDVKTTFQRKYIGISSYLH
jgi:hypothetical protein